MFLKSLVPGFVPSGCLLNRILKLWHFMVSFGFCFEGWEGFGVAGSAALASGTDAGDRMHRHPRSST